MSVENTIMSKGLMKKFNLPHIILLSEEVFYLKLLASGMDEAGIMKFLRINSNELELIKKQLTKKFNSGNYDEILNKAISTGIINKYKYVDDTIEKRALHFSDIIFEMYFESENMKASEDLLRIELEKFLAFR